MYKEFEIIPNLDGKIEYSVKLSKFQNVHKLIIHFSNQSLSKISISYLGLKGIKTNVLNLYKYLLKINFL